jgi:MYXO-CTERM domain-containing protein
MSRAAVQGALVGAALAALTGCGPADEPVAERRAELTGDSPLVEHFREAETATGVPAEMLATMSWLQTRLSTGEAPAEAEHAHRVGGVEAEDHDHSHNLPTEHGVMGIGTGGLVTLEQAASLVALTPEEVARDPRMNIRAAAAVLADEAARQGIEPKDALAWAPVLTAVGGEPLADGVIRLWRDGWAGSDDRELGVEVDGFGGDDDADDQLDESLGVVQQALGFPGAKWSGAYGGNYTNASRGASQIKYVIVHTTQGSYAGTISWFKNPSAKVSAHYVVRSSDGAVTQMVDDRDIAWHIGCFNTNSIGIEHEGFVSAPSKWYTDAMYRSSARLTSWLCDKYGIPKDRKHIMGHGEAPDCSDHTDPGSGWNWGKYMKLVENGGKVETLKAKLVKKQSSAKRFRGKKADYVACAGDPLSLRLSFKNTGSARWRDVKKRGDKIGSDVFLVTTSGKKDKLTGKVRFSVNKNKNNLVRGDRKAKNCSSKRGCRKTTFIDGGIKFTAPKKPGIYESRWRLRDYSKEWGKKSRGFGPKVGFKLKVMSCQPKNPDACGCRVWCTDGSGHKVTAAVSSDKDCRNIGATVCKPAAYLGHDFAACAPPPPPPGTGGTSSGGGSTAPMSAPSDELVATEPLALESDQELAEQAEEQNAIYTSSEPESEDELEPEDDPDFDDYGFEGDDEAQAESEAGEAASCSVSEPGARARSAALGLLGLGLLGIAIRRRRRTTVNQP